ncbi:MAG TPA: GNAT family N-acetyltransferase [Niabella sp.]|nr:GNAT family N-acetyltransferase [Niabella sp.]
MDKSIRRLSEHEIEIIQQLAYKIWPGSFTHILSNEQIAYMMEMMYAIPVLKKELERGVEFYILHYEGADVGYTAIERKNNTSYKLHKIYLSHQLHGKGLGKHQLQQMEQLVKDYGASALYLNVNRHNAAVNFYKSQGYEIVETEDISIGNGFWMNDFVMVKELK